jgi:uncharacterized protein YbjT (DUF2867 family)
VIDVTNIETLSRRRATAFFTAGTTRLLDAGRSANVRHHVMLSIVGVDRVGIGYYRAKVEQERLVETSQWPFTVLRATQFHEFPGQLLARSPGPVVLSPGPPDDTFKRRAVLVHASWPIAVASASACPWRRTDRWAGALIS